MQIEYRGFTKTNSAAAEIITTKDGFITGEWVYGYPLINEVEGKSYIVTVTQNGGYIKHEVIPETLGQLVLIAPFNNTKIYVGDYVTVDDGCVGSDYDGQTQYVVTYEECAFWLEAVHTGGQILTTRMFNECGEYTVVGNLWNKPTEAESEGHDV